MYIWPKLHFPENLFARIYTCQNVHSAEITFPPKAYFSEITFPQKFIFWKLYFIQKIILMFRLFISNMQNKLLVKIKKRCDNR